jgi:hypothetical protein
MFCSVGESFIGELPEADALAFEAQTKRVHAKTKDAVHIECTPWHGICSGMLKMSGLMCTLKQRSDHIATNA